MLKLTRTRNPTGNPGLRYDYQIVEDAGVVVEEMEELRAENSALKARAGKRTSYLNSQGIHAAWED